jgi:hypothetical protein
MLYVRFTGLSCVREPATAARAPALCHQLAPPGKCFANGANAMSALERHECTCTPCVHLHTHGARSQVFDTPAHTAGGMGVQNVVKSLFADPWPEALTASFLAAAIRRVKCGAGGAGVAAWCCELGAAVAAASPAATPRDLLMALWDACPG